MTDNFNESLELLRDMKQDTGEIEYNDYMIETERGGITKRVRYEMVDTRAKFSYLGKIFYIELDDLLAGRRNVFNFIDTVLQRLNPAVHPARFIKVSKGQIVKPEKEEEPKVEKEVKPKEEKPKEEAPKEEKPKEEKE